MYGNTVLPGLLGFSRVPRWRRRRRRTCAEHAPPFLALVSVIIAALFALTIPPGGVVVNGRLK